MDIFKEELIKAKSLLSLYQKNFSDYDSYLKTIEAAAVVMSGVSIDDKARALIILWKINNEMFEKIEACLQE